MRVIDAEQKASAIIDYLTTGISQRDVFNRYVDGIGGGNMYTWFADSRVRELVCSRLCCNEEELDRRWSERAADGKKRCGAYYRANFRLHAR